MWSPSCWIFFVTNRIIEPSWSACAPSLWYHCRSCQKILSPFIIANERQRIMCGFHSERESFLLLFWYLCVGWENWTDVDRCSPGRSLVVVIVFYQLPIAFSKRMLRETNTHFIFSSFFPVFTVAPDFQINTFFCGFFSLVISQSDKLAAARKEWSLVIQRDTDHVQDFFPLFPSFVVVVWLLNGPNYGRWLWRRHS